MAVTGLDRGGGAVSRRGRMYRVLADRGYFSHKDIAHSFGTTEKQVSKLIQETRRKSRLLTREEIIQVVIRYCKKTGRWPTRKEWKNENGLPAASTVNGVFFSYPSRSSSWRSSIGEALERLQGEIARHPSLTPKVALLLPNLTHRRNAMARFSNEQLVAHMTLVEKDPKVGTLYRLGTESTMLKVTNSTPEADGSYATYVLTTPPEMEHARQALAWTFGVTKGWESFVIQQQT